MRKLSCVSLLLSIAIKVSAAQYPGLYQADQTTPPPTLLGYLPSYREVPEQLPERLTHLIYAFAIPNDDGNLEPIENPEHLRALRALCDRHNVKLGLLVGGWMAGDDSAFEILSASEATRRTFVGEIQTLINHFDLDGIELDWEYPDENRSELYFSQLVAALAAELHQREKFLGLSLPALGNHAAAYRLSALERADYYTLMAYDSGRSEHSSLAFAEESIRYWNQRLLPLDRALLGIPAYSRPSAKSFDTLVAENWQNAYRDSQGDESWNSIPTVRKKVRLAARFGMGAAIWEIGQDTQGANSLTAAAAETLSVPPAATEPPASQSDLLTTP